MPRSSCSTRDSTELKCSRKCAERFRCPQIASRSVSSGLYDSKWMESESRTWRLSSARKVPRHENVICGRPLTKFCPGSGWSGGVILAVVLLDNSGNSQSIKSSFVDGCRGIYCVNLSTTELQFKAVLDTNIYIAAFANPKGRNAAVWNAAVDGRYELVVSPAIIREMAKVSAARFRMAERPRAGGDPRGRPSRAHYRPAQRPQRGDGRSG